jgi:hypothetical protein
MDHYEALVAREQAREVAKNVKPFKSSNIYKSKGMRSKLVPTEMLPDWFEHENQQHEKPKRLKNEQQELAKKKAELKEKLKLLRSGS